MRLAGHVGRIMTMKNELKCWLQSLNRMDQSGYLGADGKVESVELINLAQGRNQRWAFVKTVVKLLLP
jgi:hypothetical protein